MQHLARTLGKREGCIVQAISDGMGSHVVVSGKTKHGLCRCVSHKQAVALAKRVIKEGFDICEWERPPSTLAEFVSAMVFGPDFRKTLAKGK